MSNQNEVFSTLCLPLHALSENIFEQFTVLLAKIKIRNEDWTSEWLHKRNLNEYFGAETNKYIVKPP